MRLKLLNIILQTKIFLLYGLASFKLKIIINYNNNKKNIKPLLFLPAKVKNNYIDKLL